MDGLPQVLELVRQKDLARNRLRGVFHIAIGRKLTNADGTVISNGVTWRELAGYLRDLRYDTELVRELGADPGTLSPRDRLKFWYSAISLAKVGSAASFVEAEKLATALKPLGVIVGPAPNMVLPSNRPTVLPTPLDQPAPEAAPSPPPKAAKRKK